MSFCELSETIYKTAFFLYAYKKTKNVELQSVVGITFEQACPRKGLLTINCSEKVQRIIQNVEVVKIRLDSK